MRKSRALKYGIPAIELHKPELHNTQCSIVHAAQLLAISRQHLYRLIKGYGLSIIKTKGCGTIPYKDIISILEKLDTNSDCPLCPASLSLRGLMKLTNRSRCWSLKFIDRYQIHSFYIGNSRRFAYHEVKSSLDHERDNTSEWQDFDNAIRTFGIRRQTMINIIVDGRVKYLCKYGKLLVNIKDINTIKKYDMSKVSIRTRPKKDGVMASIFLEFSPPLTDPTGLPVRYEFLDLEKYIKPANHIQKNFNSTVDEIAEGIRCERYLKYVHKNYDWVAKNNPNGDFLDYFDKNIINRGIKFKCSLSYFSRFCKHECKFKNITVSYCEQFKNYLLNTEGLHRKQKLSNNSAASYFNAFMSIVQLAQSDGIIRTDIFSKVSRIVWSHDTNKEYLNPKEIKRIKRADFPEHPDLKRAVLFSIYTGLRRADILNLDWKDICICREKSYMKIIISKTQTPVTLPLSSIAIEFLGKPKQSGSVFENLSISIIHKWLPVLMRKAKITKHITFHCFRHTFAMQLLETGADIYTIATLLGHKSVTSTQVYARMSPEEAREAVLKLI